MKPSKLSTDQVTKAAVALLKHVDNVKKSEKSTLIEDSQHVLLVFSLFKIPDRFNVKPISIPLSNPLHGDEVEICVITKDPQKEYKEKFEELGIKVAKIIGISKLKKNYKSFEERRKLASSYDLFLADDRIIPMLPKALGSIFFKRKKQPVAINLKGNIQKEIENARNSTYLFLNGACSAVKIGKSDFTTEQLVENILQGTDSIVSKIPKKWKNIQSIHLKTTESIALPIYTVLPDGVPRIQPQGEEKIETKEEEVEEEEEEEEKEVESEQTKKQSKPTFQEQLKHISKEAKEVANAKKTEKEKEKPTNQTKGKQAPTNQNKGKQVKGHSPSEIGQKRKKNQEVPKRIAKQKTG